MNNSKETLEALLQKYKLAPRDPAKAEEVQALWRVLEKIASKRVHRYLKWEDPEVIGTVVSKALMGLPDCQATDRGREPHPLLAWFLTLVDHECLDQLRKRATRAETDIGDLPEKVFSAEIDWSLLEDAGASLKPDEQELLRMKLEGYTEAEIAAALDVPKRSIKARGIALLRALRRRLNA